MSERSSDDDDDSSDEDDDDEAPRAAISPRDVSNAQNATALQLRRRGRRRAPATPNAGWVRDRR